MAAVEEMRDTGVHPLSGISSAGRSGLIRDARGRRVTHLCECDRPPRPAAPPISLTGRKKKAAAASHLTVASWVRETGRVKVVCRNKFKCAEEAEKLGHNLE